MFFAIKPSRGGTRERDGALPALVVQPPTRGAVELDYLRSAAHHQHLVSAVKRDLAKGCCFVLITGTPGADGALIAQLLHEEGPKGRRASLVSCHPGTDFSALVHAYARQVGLDSEGESSGLWTLLSHVMLEARNGVTRVLVIERADLLDVHTFDELQRFTQLDAPYLMPVVLLASPALANRLETSSLGFLRAAIGSNIAFDRLLPEEVGAFIQSQFAEHGEAAGRLCEPKILGTIAKAANGDPAIVSRLVRDFIASAKGTADEGKGAGSPPAGSGDSTATPRLVVSPSEARDPAQTPLRAEAPRAEPTDAEQNGAERVESPSEARVPAQTPVRAEAPRAEPTDAEQNGAKRVEALTIARLLAPVVETRAALAVFSHQDQQWRLQLKVGGAIAGCLLIALLVGAAPRLLGWTSSRTPTAGSEPIEALKIEPSAPAGDNAASVATSAAAEPQVADALPAAPDPTALALVEPSAAAADAPAAVAPNSAQSGATGVAKSATMPATESADSSSANGLASLTPAPSTAAAGSTAGVPSGERGISWTAPSAEAPPENPVAPPIPAVPPKIAMSLEPTGDEAAQPSDTTRETVPPARPMAGRLPLKPSVASPAKPTTASPPAPTDEQPSKPVERASSTGKGAATVAAEVTAKARATAGDTATEVPPAPPVGSAPTLEAAPRGSDENPAATPEKVAALEAAPAMPPPDRDAQAAAEAEAIMMRRGDQLLASGDIISARRFFERVASGGNVAALYGVAKTFDPLVLREMRAIGLSGDAATAMAWYRKAADAGSDEARARLQRLSAAYPKLATQEKR